MNNEHGKNHILNGLNWAHAARNQFSSHHQNILKHMSVQSQPGYLFQKGVWRDSETDQVLDIDRFWVAGQVGLDHFLLLDAVINHFLLGWMILSCLLWSLTIFFCLMRSLIIFSCLMQSPIIFSWVGSFSLACWCSHQPFSLVWCGHQLFCLSLTECGYRTVLVSGNWWVFLSSFPP